MKHKYFLAALVIFSLSSLVFTQNKTKKIIKFENEIGKVTLTNDDFSDKKKVSLSKTVVSEDFAFELEGNFAKKVTNVIEIPTTPVQMKVYLLNRQNPTLSVPMGFLVDGELVKSGELRSLLTMYEEDGFYKNGVDSPSSFISFSDLEKIAKGKSVKVKIHDQIYDLKSEIIQLFKDFVSKVKAK